ncbi:hypothetical protein EPUL_004039 [Erysiphe pulchra]|uniref:Uncharacterized protein n=1 Tax=Erysiphe pulchra TaxID=225359 RepID=A0A2S4PKX1_9PEZI|nr:hypothetical protein EPUL_004039 [Erysiphe pulchra]
MTTFRVVFTRDSDEVVGVVSKITTNDYTKCIRRDNSYIGSSHLESEDFNGFLCGNRFFADEIIQQSLALAQTSVQGSSIYPYPYFGLLYPADEGFLMWPIMRGKKLYKSGKTAHIGPFYLILNKERLFVDVVVSGYGKNFLRCIRSRQAPKAPASDPHSKLFVQPPKPGYLCGKTFFDNKVLEDAAKIAKKHASKVVKSKFPQSYSGHPYYKPCLIWPLLKDGNIYRRGMKAPYRLILTPNYEVMSVAILVKNEFKACDKKIIKSKKKHDESDYHCFKQNLSYQQLVDAAEKACVQMNSAVTNHFPAGYEGPKFNSEGPYFTYPAVQ